MLTLNELEHGLDIPRRRGGMRFRKPVLEPVSIYSVQAAISFRRSGTFSRLIVWQGLRMRRLTCFLGLVLALGFCGTAAAAEPDPPHKHYAVSRLPADPDLATAKPMGRYRGFLRESVDLTPQMPPVGDQGELVSGTAWAVAYAARSYYAGRNEGRDIESPENEASPGYVYNLALQGDCNEGATISKTVEVLQKGAVSLAAFPYKPECQPPSTSLISSAKDFRVKGYHVLDRSHIDDIKGQIERQNPVVVQFRVSPAFLEFRGGGIFDEVDFDSAGSEDRWQTLTIIGYNDDKLQAARVMNSWGRGWGDDGYAWISYAALTNRISGAVVLDVAAWQGLPPKKEEAKDEPKQEPKQEPKDVAKDEPKEQPKDVAKDEPKERPKPKVKPTLADLRNLSCGKIDEIRANGRVTLNGFVGSDEDLEKVREVVKQEPGYSLGKVTVAPWPLCEALDTLDKPLKAAAIHPTLKTSPAEVAKAGELLRVELQSPAKPSYVYLSYFTADEKVITLAQPQGMILPQTPAGRRLVFGDGIDGRAAFPVKEPFGNEMVVAIASASPLFDSQLPQILSEREFLSALRKALIYKPVANMADREVGAAIQVLKTEAR
ncbi:MAG: C1 family peptidase [Beijerinckiaceae bacterium]